MATFLTTPVRITVNTGTNNTWRDVDLSASVPSGSTGAIMIASGLASNVAPGFRKKGSTDTDTITLPNTNQTQVLVGCDANRVIQVVSGNVLVDYDLWLIGYFGSEAVFFDNKIGLGTLTGTYTDYNIASNTGADTAIAAFVQNTGCYQFGARKNGSTDTLNRNAGTGPHYAIVGCDGSEIFEARGDVAMSLVGYMTNGIVYHTSAIDRSTGTTGSFQSISGSGGAVGYMFQAATTNVAADTFSLRNSGQTIDPNKRPADGGSVQLSVGVSPEQKISATTMDMYEVGYFTAVAAGDTLMGQICI